MWKRAIAGTGLLLIAVAGCSTVPATTGSNPASTPSRALGSVAASRTPEPVPMQSASPSATAPPPVAVAAPPVDQTFQGRGDKVLALHLEEGYVHIATITHQGSSNFSIKALDATGAMTDLVVNEIGTYSGVRPLDLRSTPAALQIRADGSWKIVVQIAQKAPLWTGASSGKGAAVLRISPDALDGLTTVKITHNGTSNFAVWAYGNSSNLLVNEIGAYTGETLLPQGTVLLEVKADGAWSIRKS